MKRRVFLSCLAASGVAGCLSGSGSNTKLRGNLEHGASAYSHLAPGDRVPDVSLMEPLRGKEVSIRDFDTPVLMTFMYSNCRTVCPKLTGILRNVQTDAVENGYSDEVNFVEVTFDPERDTAEKLRKYNDEMSIDYSAGDWHYLRPKNRSRAEKVVESDFGVYFNRTHPDDMEKYMFSHLGLILLVNRDGYVEKAYRVTGSGVTWQKVRDDLKKLLD